MESTTFAPISTKYEGDIEISVTKCKQGTAAFVRGVGNRLMLESFQGDHRESMVDLLGRVVGPKRNELADLQAIYGEEEAKKILEKDSTSAVIGNLISGYAIIEKLSKKIIGRLSFQGNGIPGESMCRLVIAEGYRNQGYGVEAAALCAGLALLICSQNTRVGPIDDQLPVKHFAATVLSKDLKAISWIEQKGLQMIRTFFNEQRGEQVTVYGIDSANLRDTIDKRLMDSNKIKLSIDVTSPIQKSKSPQPPFLNVVDKPQ